MEVGASPDFWERASAFLSDWSVGDALALAANSQGFWHPTGFAAFHTSVDFEGMPVRVHCWCRGQRPVEGGHPALHTHLWPLVSKVLYGEYSETLYELREDTRGELVRYAVHYHSRDDSTVHEDGVRYTVASEDRRIFAEGDLHAVSPGEWHESTIPQAQQVVTAMVTGRPTASGPFLAGRPGFLEARRIREPVPNDLVVEEFGPLVR